MRKTFYIVLLIIIGLIIVGIINSNKIVTFFNKSTAGTSIPPKIQERKGLGLTQFYQWTKEDPLFTSPDFDSQQFLKVAEVLEMEEESLLAFLKAKDPLYPVAFLKDAVEVDRLHRNFLADPALAQAWELIAAYRKAQKNYQQVQQSTLNVLKDETLFSSSEFFVGINSSSTFGTIRKDYQTLGLNIQQLDKEISRRETCLEKAEECIVPSDNFKEPEIEKDNASFSKKDFLSLNILLPKSGKEVQLFGPYIASTACYGFSRDLKAKAYPFYVSDKTTSRLNNGLNQQSFKLATTNYYKKLDKANTQGAGSYLLKSNSDWVVQLETQLYMCTDPTYEANLVAIDKFYQKYNKSPLFEKILALGLPEEVKQAAKKGDLLEQSFFSQEYPSETGAENLANYYAYFYKVLRTWTEKNSNTAEAKESIKYQDEFLTRSLEYSRKLGNVTSVMSNAIKNVNQLRVRFSIASKLNNPLKYMYGFRTFYGLFYLSFSPSFYRLDEPLAFLEKKFVEMSPDSRGAHITYQQALKDHTPEEISKWVINNHDLLEEAIAEYRQKHPGVTLAP